MKLLFDENLSPRLVGMLVDAFPGSIHVEIAVGRAKSDEGIWNLAIDSSLAIVSKDNDFRQRAFASGPPPKVVWLDVGNAGTVRIERLLRDRVDEIERFGSDPVDALLEIRL